MATGMTCPNEKCRSRRIWKKGVVPTRTGQKARYVCFECGKTFYASAGKPRRGRKKKESK